MFRAAHRRALAGLLLLAAMLPALGAERGWLLLQGDHYEVLSQLDERETLAWTGEFDQFVQSMSQVLQVDRRRLPMLRIVLFARDRDFIGYKPARPDGSPAELSGVFVRQQNWSVIGLAHDADSNALRRTILHEATHWLMSAREGRQAAWYMEGMAELLSTFGQRGDEVSWARPITAYVLDLRRGTMPLREMLLQPSALFDEDRYTDLFYAQAWAFVHFLLYSGDPALPQLIDRYLDVYRGLSPEEAMQAAFGQSLPQLEQRFLEYLKLNRFTYAHRPAARVSAPAAPVPAAAAHVEATLGFLAVGAERRALARRHADAVAQLDPQSPAAHEIRAHLAWGEDDMQQAARHAAEAVRLDTRDSDMYVLLGNSLFTDSQDIEQATALRRVELYMQAVRLDRNHAAPYERLAEGLFSLQEPDGAQAAMLRDGLGAFPGNDWIRAGLAVVQFRLGLHDEAAAAMARALARDSSLDDGQRSFASGLWQDLRYQAASNELNAALARNDLAAARELAATMLEHRDIAPDMRAFLERLRDSAPRR